MQFRGRDVVLTRLLQGFVEGSTRVLRQGYELGIKHYAIVSSVAALVDPVNGPPGALLTDKGASTLILTIVLAKSFVTDWNELTWEEAVKPGVGAPSVYGASKSFAEKEIWEFAEAHPEISVTTRQYFITGALLISLTWITQFYQRCSWTLMLQDRKSPLVTTKH